MSETFEQCWNVNFPNKVPISHVLKYYFSEFWFRIHSLADSKRYADNQSEIQLLLDRQNQIITDCFGSDTCVYLVTGNYLTPHSSSDHDVRKIICYTLIESLPINLHQIDPTYFDDGDKNESCFLPLSERIIWKPIQHNDLLLKIANDEVEAFLISFEKEMIVAPYDGGIDFIIWDALLRQQLKDKYQNCLVPNGW